MKLFRVDFRSERKTTPFYVIANSPNDAAQSVLDQWNKWKYGDGFVQVVETIAEPNQYGKPEILLFQKGLKINELTD